MWIFHKKIPKKFVKCVGNPVDGMFVVMCFLRFVDM